MSSIINPTQAIANISVISGVKEHKDGRLYNASQEEYALPADQEEIRRLNSQHRAIVMSFNGHIPEDIKEDLSKKEKPRILDVGCGTGIWAIEVGEQLPNSEVVGIDLVSIHSEHHPLNVKFQRMDILEDFPKDWQGTFDLIHIRYLVVGVPNFDLLLPKIGKLLRPNGYLVSIEPDLVFKAEGYDETTSVTIKFATLVNQALNKLGRPTLPSKVVREVVQSSELFDLVRTELSEIPLSPWSDDERMKEIGNEHRKTTIYHGSAFKRLVLNAGYVSEEEYDLVCKGVEEEVSDAKMKLIFPVWMNHQASRALLISIPFCHSIRNSGVKEHTDGRGYNETTGEYILPADREEAARSDFQHKAIVMLFQGLVPEHIQKSLSEKEKPRILDVGRGTGCWSLDMASQYPEAEVIGRWENSFDLIYIRYLFMGVRDFTSLLERLTKLLKPDGHLICMEPTAYWAPVEEKDKELASMTIRYSDIFTEAMKLAGIDNDPPKVMRQYLDSNKDYKEVKNEYQGMPLSPCSDDERLKQCGETHLSNSIQMIQVFRRLILESKVINEEEYDQLSAQVEVEFREAKGELVLPIWRISAQKV
ncbi:uncharacterized protein L201_006411 [Kwoniella dendrophila CBS 6074]|uniref:Methyltransferase domain-containing protein n=1 Tax=Kwoniella dendrophila CBS 6074 TaxID=1295534 RepID=A0AAX4K1F0_9TREE